MAPMIKRASTTVTLKKTLKNAAANKIELYEITLPKEPCPRTLSSSNCDGSAFRQAFELTTSSDTSMRDDLSSSTGYAQKKFQRIQD